MTETKVKSPRTGRGSLRFPAFITLALSVTRCSRCPGKPLIYSAVVHGLERRFDPLPLAPAGLAAAVAEVRYVAVVRPWGHPVANTATPGHWWVRGLGAGFRPTLLASHAHDRPALAGDLELALALLPRFLPPEQLPAADPNEPCPF